LIGIEIDNIQVNKLKPKNTMNTLFLNNRFLLDYLAYPDPDSTPITHKWLSSNAVYKIEDNKLKIALSVLGHDPKKVDVELTEDRIFIKAESDKESKSVSKYLVDDLDETLRLGKDFNGLTANASIENGILYIEVDKKEEAKPKKISVKF
jgi:HSP20 family molecular chaperone IbpA